MSKRRLLVAEGNVAAVRQTKAAVAGTTPGQDYAAVLRGLAPDAEIEICCPADPDPALPAPLDSYDGIVVTGSALNIHRREPGSLRQIAFAQAVFERGVPMFGSCWGLQLAAVASGGEVARNPRGREVGFARQITLTEAGRRHPMHAGRDLTFDAPAIHSDEVVRLPASAMVTASNGVSAVQAAEIRCGRGVFWGVQYHPEYRLSDVAATLRGYGQTLVDEGFFDSLDDLCRDADDLAALEADPSRRDLATRLAIGRDLLVAQQRSREIANWLACMVRGGAPQSTGGRFTARQERTVSVAGSGSSQTGAARQLKL